MNSPGEGLKGSHEGVPSSDAAAARECGACGSAARRPSARYCSTCGREFVEDYFPADSLRASYRFESPRESYAIEAARGPRVKRQRHQRPRRRVALPKGFRGSVMQGRDSSGASSSALAFAAYALVPYLGILFCPGALLFGGVGLVRSLHAPHAAGRRDSALGLALGLLILCAQLLLWWILLLLWWILYKVPEWSRHANF
jgi:hypothetical protein